MTQPATVCWAVGYGIGLNPVGRIGASPRKSHAKWGTFYRKPPPARPVPGYSHARTGPAVATCKNYALHVGMKYASTYSLAWLFPYIQDSNEGCKVQSLGHQMVEWLNQYWLSGWTSWWWTKETPWHGCHRATYGHIWSLVWHWCHSAMQNLRGRCELLDTCVKFDTEGRGKLGMNFAMSMSYPLSPNRTKASVAKNSHPARMLHVACARLFNIVTIWHVDASPSNRDIVELRTHVQE